MKISLTWNQLIDYFNNDNSSVFDAVNKFLPLVAGDDEQELEALKHSLQQYSERVLALEDEERQLIAWNSREDWKIYLCQGETNCLLLSRLIGYMLNLENLQDISARTAEKAPYSSLKPVVYNGGYWLDKICREEFYRHEELDRPLNLLFIEQFLPPRPKLAAKLLGEVNRVGTFDEGLAVLLPCIDKIQVLKLVEKLAESFKLSGVHIWSAGTDFTNIYEMRNRVKKIIE